MSFSVLSLKGEKRQVISLDFERPERNACLPDSYKVLFMQIFGA